MKPRTKFQHKVCRIAGKLPAIKQKHYQWAIDKVIVHPGTVSAKREIHCYDCNHSFYYEDLLADVLEGGKKVICPNCGRSLKVMQTRQRVFRDRYIFGIATTYDGVQIIRYVIAKVTFKKGEQPSFDFTEIMQKYISDKGVIEMVARAHMCSPYYYDLWSYGSPMELRSGALDNRNIFALDISEMYPQRRYSKLVSRNGFDGKHLCSMPMEILFQKLISDPKFETLYKAGQYDVCASVFKRGYINLKENWAELKICIRNNYIIDDAISWFDYVSMLRRLGKDTHNAVYVCPENLKEAHDKVQEKLDRIAAKKRLEQQREEIAKYEKKYQKFIKKYADLKITDGVIVIEPLRSVMEFFLEGQMMHHCVYQSGYYKHKDCLILSARIGDKHIETAEIRLSNKSIVQCRGKCNSHSDYHDQIVALINDNMARICSSKARKTA